MVPVPIPRWFLAVATAVQFVVIAVVVIVFAASRDNTNSVNALYAQNKALRAQTSQQATATRAFVSEINFICQVSAARAAQSHLPMPSPGLCDLSVP